jgi:hypothetical protein
LNRPPAGLRHGQVTIIDFETGSGARHARALLIASLLLLAVYFAVSSSPGLHAYFTQDDGGNLLHMHKYWERSLLDVLGSPLRVVTGAFRPLGGVYYFVLYRLAGFNPVPFRVTCLALMLVNLFLAFALLRRLSGSLEVALLGGVLIANHPAMLELFYSSGTIYEILCFFFYFLALWLYLGWRQAGGRSALSWRQLAVLLVLTGCALDSKEMAMTLPGALLLIELVYFPPESWSWLEIVRFVSRQMRGPLLAAALVAPTIAVKVLTSNPLSDDPRYAGHSLRGTADAMCAYFNFLLYGDLFSGGLTLPKLAALWVAMALAAVVLRSRPMKFGLLFLTGSLLPVCLIAPRGGYMLYIPLAGWALYCACLFQRLRNYLLRWLQPGPKDALAARAGTVAIAAALIMDTHAAKLAQSSASLQSEQNGTRRVLERLRKVHPSLPRGSSLLVVDDPLPPNFGLLFLARVAYGDPTLELDRLKMLGEAPAGEQLTRYDYVLAGGFEARDVRGISDARPPVEIGFRPSQVRPGQAFTLAIPEYAGETVDLAVHQAAQDRAERAILLRCTLDSSGNGALPPAANIPATMQVRWVRPSGGNWMSASGKMEIRP